MRAIRLHGPSDLRLDDIAHPGNPAAGEALLRISAVGICGSDLHTYLDARIGDTAVASPLVLGHEFSGVIETTGSDAIDGMGQPLVRGTPVAVDPAWPCGICDLCGKGHPNLCVNMRFAGLFPQSGALCTHMNVPASACFAIPGLSAAQGALLETLGVALHAVDLAKIRVGDTVAILGAGPIGLSILQGAKLAGASRIIVTDKFPWRLKLAATYGAEVVNCDQGDPVESVQAMIPGGVDVAIEAAWADQSIQQAAAMTRNGGRLVLVGIPGDDRLVMRHSTARRKGLTIRMARRMKHAYPRAIDLTRRGAVDLMSMVTHRFQMEETPSAYAMNAAYKDNIIKAVIEVA